MPQPRPTLSEAFEIAEEYLGHPCGCESCSKDGGRKRSIEVSDLAYDLAGVTPTRQHDQE